MFSRGRSNNNQNYIANHKIERARQIISLCELIYAGPLLNLAMEE